MAGEILVRRAESAEGPLITQMAREAIRESAASFYSPDQIETWASAWGDGGIERELSQSIAFVAEVDGRIIGFANLDGGDVGQLYVHPSHGGQGVARALYAAIEATAIDGGISRLTAMASLRSAPVFVRFGFTRNGEVRRELNGVFFDVVLVSKVL